MEQVPEAAGVLERRAAEKTVKLETVKVEPVMSRLKIVPDADYQQGNASLAVALVGTVLTRLNRVPRLDSLFDAVADGLEQTTWRGRCEIKQENGRKWCLDGAHTVDSLRVASRWFAQEAGPENSPRILIFNQQSRSEAVDLLKTMQETLQFESKIRFFQVIFCTNVTRKETGYRKGRSTVQHDLRTGKLIVHQPEFINHNTDAAAVKTMAVQKEFARAWAQSDPDAKIHTIPTIQEAIELAQELSEDLGETQIFVTGSLHLVSCLFWKEPQHLRGFDRSLESVYSAATFLL